MVAQSPAAPVPPVAPAEPAAHAWQRGVPGWHGVFGLLATLTAVLFLTEDGVGAARRFTGVVLLAVLTAWYAVTGARALRRESARLGVAYAGLAGPLTVGLFAVRPVGAVMLFILYPHLWAMLPLRWAMAGTAAAVAAVGAVSVVWSGDGGLVGILVPAGIALLMAGLLGLWITRIIEQSRRRAEILAELRATRAELAQVSHEAGALAERERLARDIHDTLAQGFASVLLLVEAVDTDLDRDPAAARRRLAQIARTARENLAEARSLVAGAAPADLAGGALPEALARLVARTGGELGVAAEFSVTGAPYRLPAGHEVALLRATQEALANVRKHAAAGRVEVSIGYTDDRVSLLVRDDGCGFDPAAGAAAGPGAGYGLAGMRERVRQLGGELTLRTAPGAGVSVGIDLPRPGARQPGRDPR